MRKHLFRGFSFIFNQDKKIKIRVNEEKIGEEGAPNYFVECEREGNWVYGYFHLKDGRKSEPSIITEDDRSTYHVNRDTVGEYIGLNDSIDKMIFEDDIVTVYLTPFIVHTGIVYFDERAACYGIKCNNGTFLFLDYFEAKRKDPMVYLEVIGTKFDIPTEKEEV